jgi:cytochrome c551
MMKWKPLIAVAGMVVLTACSSSVAEDASGEEIYSQLCARCHADDLSGRVGPALGAGSNSAGEPDSYLVQTITFGSGRMPAFRSSLSETQIERVVEYIRGEQAGVSQDE